MAVKISENETPKELEIMKICDFQFLVRLLDSFSFEGQFGTQLYGIAMEYYEVSLK